jgi:hypothetical protein
MILLRCRDKAYTPLEVLTVAHTFRLLYCLTLPTPTRDSP